MRRFLLTVVLLVFLCPITAQASETEQSYEDYLNEMDWLTENDPTFSFAEQFCEDYGIESYRELDLIISVYYAAMDNGFDSYSDMEDASMAQYIIEYEIGEETIDELRELQEEYGYRSIDELLQAVDEIGYSEITGDYSYLHSDTDTTQQSREVTQAEKSYQEPEEQQQNSFKKWAINFWDKYWFIVLFVFLPMAFWICLYFSIIIHDCFCEYMKRRKERKSGSDKLS